MGVGARGGAVVIYLILWHDTITERSEERSLNVIYNMIRAMKVSGRIELYVHSFLPSALDGRKWLNS
jgi:hypothetical protein